MTITTLPFSTDGRPQTAAANGLREFLTFRLGSVDYGIDILRVREIRGYEAPTPMAGAPDFVKGLLNLRGVIIPIVDLRSKFGLPRVVYDHLTVTVILSVADRVVGVVVDAVSDVVALSAAQIKPMPAIQSGTQANFITGIGAPGRDETDDMLILLDIEKLMLSTDMGLACQTVQ